MDKESVAVIVVTPAADEDLEHCLASLKRQTTAASEIAVVINGDRASVRRLDKWKADLPLRITILDRNEGFATPHSLVLKDLKSQWVAVLNADAVAEADWLDESLSAAQTGSDIGMVASAVLMADDPARLESLGLEASRGGFAYLKRWGEPWSEDAAHEIFGPAGAAALFRREMLDDIGFFDPDMFAYYEDMDLAWRARWRGWRCVAAPRARIHHKGSAHSAFADKLALLHRNRLLVIAADWTARMIWSNIFSIVAWDFLSIAKAARDGKIKSALHARRQFIKMLPGALKKRRALKNRVSGAEIWLVDDKSRARARGILPI